ncbi:hypothetical protein MMPV_002370 [Pyropia vietnamensis]
MGMALHRWMSTATVAVAAAIVAVTVTGGTPSPASAGGGALPRGVPLVDPPSAHTGNCVARVVATWTLPPTPLGDLNPGLPTPSGECGCGAAAKDAGSVCGERPAIGSGLAAVSPGLLVGVTDQGPTQVCAELAAIDGGATYPAAAGKAGRGFPFPAWAPTLAYFVTPPPEDEAGQIELVRSVPLRGTDGRLLSGLPNTDRDDTPYAGGCVGEPLPYDVGGVDTEDVAPIPGTDLLVLVEEYAPSVLVVHATTGRVLARYVPHGLVAALETAPYPVIGALPDVLLARRKNRGLEALAVAADGKSLIAIMQSPMGSAADGLIENVVIRMVRMDIHVDARDAARLSYAGMYALEGSPPAAYTVAANVAKDLKVSAAAGLPSGGMLVLERAKGQVKLFRVDIDEATTKLDDTKYGGNNLSLERATNGVRPLAAVGVTPARKVLVWDSAQTAGGTANWTGSSKQEGLVVVNSATVLLVSDSDFGIGGADATVVTQLQLGRSLDGSTVCDEPTMPPPPPVNNQTVGGTRTLRLVNKATYRRSNEPDGGAAEVVTLDADRGVVYAANGQDAAVDVYTPATVPVSLRSSLTFGNYSPTSVAVCGADGVVAVALAADDDDAKGRVALLSPTVGRDGAVTGLTVARLFEDACFLPDQITWSDNCAFLVAACEGEGAAIPGSVWIYTAASRTVVNAGFGAYDDKVTELRAKGVRLIDSDVPSLDFEPEYVAISGTTAYVALQENNALAVVDLLEGVVAEIKSFGYVDRSVPGNGLDASNKDGDIRIRSYPQLFGMPQPDAMVKFTSPVDNQVYLIMANEGDARDGEAVRAAALLTDLNRTMSPKLASLVSDEAALGRLLVTQIDGYDEATNTQLALYAYGGRSFSILCARTGEVVYHSGELLARIQERFYPSIFNSEVDPDALAEAQLDLRDTRSDDKGGEPESVAIYPKDGRVFAVVALERTSVLTLWDVTDVHAVRFVDAASNHPTNRPTGEVFAAGDQGDVDPEGLAVDIKRGLLYVGGAFSNTVSTYGFE